MFHSFIDQIVIPAGDGLLEVRGDLGRMLATAAGERDGSILAAVVDNGCRGVLAMGNKCYGGRRMTRGPFAPLKRQQFFNKRQDCCAGRDTPIS
jgi:hypothetical protein